MIGRSRKRRQAGANGIGVPTPAGGRGAGVHGSAGAVGGAAAVGVALPVHGGIRSAGAVRPASKKAAANERETAYSTRYYMWALLISGWLFTTGASIARGQMPEIFVAVVLTGILLQGLLPWIASRTARLELSRDLSSLETSAGGEMKVKVTVRTRIPLPLLWVSMRETLVNDCGTGERTVQFRHITLPWGSKTWRIHYTVRGLERGEYRFRPMEAVFGDMLGLTAVRRVIGKAGDRSGSGSTGTSFLVMPAWHGTVAAPGYGGRVTSVQESGYPVPTAGGYGQSANSGPKTRSNMQRTTADRGGSQRLPYRPGDDARRIDWRAAARGGAWMTKREYASRPPELLVAMDMSSAAYSGDDRLFDCAAGYTAELVRHASAEQVPFRLLGMESMQSGGRDSRSAAGPRHSHEREALERLALVRPMPSSSSGELAIGPAGDNHIPRGATIIVVTAEWRHGAIGERLAALAAANGCRSEVHVLTSNKVPSVAMRERKRDWECAGIRVVWAVVPDDEDMPGKGVVAEGGDADDDANG
ncbi:DUF58 domain-containing protein [Paenibacillus kobensis]|uniref:DUF58 domain-containing protein n=1 Tax=Paenibacillus kobensis TaxID=59841 RepID=UPI000FD81318|nr:DUF58 domain-containing protein [Paenibacillus kobensis]